MSPKLLLPILILIPLVVLALVFLPPSSPPTPDPLAPPAGGELTTQNSQPDPASPVAVSVGYLPDRSSADVIVFRVLLNTHSVDLDGIDFQKSVVLEKSGQRFSPLEVIADGSDHHRWASVKFNLVSGPLKLFSWKRRKLINRSLRLAN